MLTFANDHDRLMSKVVIPGNVAGYIVYSNESDEETLYAVAADGSVQTQTQPMNAVNFGVPGEWRPADSCPANASYCGNYKI